MLDNTIDENKFGAQTLFALRHTGEICGSNGLPLTPKSIGILGKSQILKKVKHKHLTAYLDFIRGKHERLLIVSEFHEQNLTTAPPASETHIIKIAYELLNALRYLNSYGIVHRTLSPDNILLTREGEVKLFNYGLYHMTNQGRDVEFPIGSVKYTAPEVLASIFNAEYNSGPKVDVWSLGIIIAELIFKKSLWPALKLGQYLRKVLSLIYCDDVLSRFARETDSLKVYQDMNPVMKGFLETCLHVDPRRRPTPEMLLRHEIFDSFQETVVSELEALEMSNDAGHPLNSWELNELYYLWHLAGGDVQTELKRSGLIKNKPPILSTPGLILLEGMSFGLMKDCAYLLDLKVAPLSLESLTMRLKHIMYDAYYLLLENENHSLHDANTADTASHDLPLIIRERDTEYQFHRVILYKRLLQSYPYTRNRLLKEASRDIPPFYRGEIWAALLDVKGDIEIQYTSIDKETTSATDRQIEVDIPRCHQYNELLSSKSGHLKLKRILKAWVINNQQYVYWQGLDSLCAPFLYLNFNNEARAYACLSAFVPKYLHNFFLKDNSAVIKEYLAKFSHLIAYHDPILANHLHEINFVPELFAIPWFLTMFSHVFPLHKIFHLWDKLLLGDSSYPLFVGLSILQQLRDTLLASGFNECILLFSDLPEIDIERCVTNSTKLYDDTPRSLSFRKFQQSSTKSSDFLACISRGIYLYSRNWEQMPLFEAEGFEVARICGSCFLTVTHEMLQEIQKEINPRLSIADFLDLVNNKNTRSNVLIVDGRLDSEFNEKSVPGSVSIPYESINFEKDIREGIPSSPELSILMNNKGKKMIVVIGRTIPEAAKISSYFTNAEFPKVCLLNGDINCLHYCGILAPAIT